MNMGDTGNGFLWATAVIQALYHRERTGQGQKVSTAIINATLLATSYAYSLADGTPVDRPRIDARQRGLSALHGLYRLAGDDWLSIAVLDEAAWPDLCEALAAPELLADPRFADATARVARDTELRAALEPLFARRDADDVVAAFEKRDLPCELSVDTFGAALFTDPALRALGDVVTATVPGVGTLEQAGVLVSLADNPGRVPGPPCLAGEHTRAILAELGYDAAAAAALVEARSVLAL
ncbi:CoA transferase [Frankia sp. CNm7]|nr:CoA transferase [Frankia nepalensis]MBL7521032.1 CoA transferase [Frankia nepalensis]